MRPSLGPVLRPLRRARGVLLPGPWLDRTGRPLRRAVRALRTTRRTVAAVPDAVEAILLLPVIAERLEVISFQTATLRDMHDEIARVRGDTAMLRQIETNTLAVQQLAEVIVPLQSATARLGRFADRLPQRRL